VIKYFLIPQNDDIHGYRPLDGVMKKPNTQSTPSIPNNIKKVDFDNNFINSFREFILTAKENGVILFLTISPSLTHENEILNSSSLNMMRSIAAEYQIPVLDFAYNTNFIEQYQLFNDPSHLNNSGAEIFTRLVVDSIKVIHYKNIVPVEIQKPIKIGEVRE
jgi:hypothetical protein